MKQKGSSLTPARPRPRPLPFRRRLTMRVGLGIACALLALVLPGARADQVEMQNGDHYVGSVLSLTADTLVLRNEVLGQVRFPRNKVARITMDAAPSAGTAPLPSPAPAKPRAAAATNSSPAIAQIGAHTNLIRQVQKQFLSDAGPEANQKFDELLNGLMSGKISMDDLRAQAQSAANQLRDLKRKGGEDAGLATDTYLAILDHFLKEMPASVPATNLPAPGAKPVPADE
jgi:hypothetical protein